MNTKEMTICIKCAFYLNLAEDEDERDIWFNQYCKADKLPLVIDPVTGKKGPGRTNDLGEPYMADKPYPYCRDINRSGQCPLYKKKGAI